MMYGIRIFIASNDSCSRCGVLYRDEPDRFKTMVSFVDPAYQKDASTIFGAECCNICASSIVCWGAAQRLDICAVYGIGILKLSGVHFSLLSWSYFPPQSHSYYFDRHRSSVNQLIKQGVI